jgi:hypothetical protein
MSLLNMLGRNPAAMDEMEKARQLGLQKQQQQQQQQQQPQQQGPSMWQRFNQPQNWAALSNAFNTLRFQPDQGLAASNQKVIDYAQTAKAANKTVEYLRRVGRDDLAQAVEADPTVAADALKIAAGVGGAANKTFAPILQPDGTYAVPTVDSAGNITVKTLEGVTGETAAQKYAREAELQNKQADNDRAVKLGQDAYAQVDSLDRQLSKLDQISRLVDEGAETGVIRNYFPAINAATAELRSLAGALGIDIINSATFGALSAPELDLALKTAIDTTLEGDELKETVKAKIKAQAKLRNELMRKAYKLTRPNASYAGYVEEEYRDRIKRRKAPEGFNPDDWAGLSVDERIEFLELGR